MLKAMSIALLYERSENDENGIKLTAQQLGIDLTYIPFRKIALSISKDGFSARHRRRAKPCPEQKSPPPSLIFHGDAGQKNPKLIPNRIHLLQQTTHITASLEGRHPDS
jgi:hypothetical protein